MDGVSESDVMKEHPILFSSPMVRTILNGRKSMTRRVIKPQPTELEIPGFFVWKTFSGDTKESIIAQCPYGQPGDRLWVRETWNYITKAENEYFTHRRLDGCPVQMLYRADNDWDLVPFWKPSIFMPRWASRITLEITGVRVERVQDISGRDALAEGVTSDDVHVPYWQQFAQVWNSLNAKRGYSWDSNPWVWAISFKVVGQTATANTPAEN